MTGASADVGNAAWRMRGARPSGPKGKRRAPAFQASVTEELSTPPVINYFQTRPVSTKGRVQGPTHVNSAVLERRSVLGKTQDEEPHAVLLPAPQAEAEAPRASLQLHGAAAQALGGGMERHELRRAATSAVWEEACLSSWRNNF